MSEIKGTNASLMFKVTREPAELLTPIARPTPCKQNNQDSHECYWSMILFYKNEEHSGGVTLRGKDPAEMVRDAVKKALGRYYPSAEWGRDEERGGEGVVFVEANGDVILEDFGETICPPFPCLDKLLCHVISSSSDGVSYCPLLLIQVTRVKCGGFVLAFRFNHTMVDANGIVQFMNTVAMLARGAEYPPIEPIWACDAINDERAQPRAVFAHHQRDDVKGPDVSLDHLVNKSFFFGPNEMAIIQHCLPPQLSSTPSTFEVLTSYLWRTRTIALDLDSAEVVHIKFSVDTRSAETTAGKLTSNSLEYALELVKKANDANNVTKVSMKSSLLSTFTVEDMSWVGFDKLDFGWGLPVYGGTAEDGFGVATGFKSCYVGTKNWLGENGIMVPICLPRLAMDRFVMDLKGLFMDRFAHCKSSNAISSSL